ncbi:hypothetical protein [Planctomycetes bacterium K23_9]|uniref:Uncharacterized protein n=1 Tax=Stieleria marina TaxID=1930275 RepID=A0A517NTB8_9BACT|nr:hypothetical protein K239x_23260 [Planctomycetes bacterium K23_9]
MFALELGLVTVGLSVAFLSHGQRRRNFQVAILLFLISLITGSVALVIGGIAVLGSGVLESSLIMDRGLRRRVFATTGILLAAAIVLPALHNSHDDRVEASTSRSDELLRTKIDPLKVLSENRDLVDSLARDAIDQFRQRAIQLAQDGDGAEISTTVNFKAPAKLLGLASSFASQPANELHRANESNTAESGRLQFHASLNDASTCNQCHDVGNMPLHAAIHYELEIGDLVLHSGGEVLDKCKRPNPPCKEPAQQPSRDSDQPAHQALDPGLIVHAN